MNEKFDEMRDRAEREVNRGITRAASNPMKAAAIVAGALIIALVLGAVVF
jgi:hypothetical protein